MKSVKESELGELFQEFIKLENKLGYRFDIIFEEIESIQGIPDYVGVNVKEIGECKKFLEIVPQKNWYTISNILSQLSYLKGHKLEYLHKHTGISMNVLEKELFQLVKNGLVKKDEKDNYVLSDDVKIPELKVVSFELKMKNWKRALFQSIRYKTFSDYVYVVMPIEKKQLLNNNIHLFAENNIGIILYDDKKNVMRMLLRAKKNSQKSKAHSYYMNGKILYEYKNKKQVSATVSIV